MGPSMWVCPCSARRATHPTVHDSVASAGTTIPGSSNWQVFKSLRRVRERCSPSASIAIALSSRTRNSCDRSKRTVLVSEAQLTAGLDAIDRATRDGPLKHERETTWQRNPGAAPRAAAASCALPSWSSTSHRGSIAFQNNCAVILCVGVAGHSERHKDAESRNAKKGAHRLNLPCLTGISAPHAQ